jgi:hypothetical protein
VSCEMPMDRVHGVDRIHRLIGVGGVYRTAGAGHDVKVSFTAALLR